jgi:hypothetical protein
MAEVLAQYSQRSQLSAMTPEQQLKSFIAKFDSANQKLIRATRRAMRKRLPTATELVYDNYNFFVIGYSPTERPSDAVFSIAAQAKGVSLCLLNGARLPDPNKILRGAGNQVRSIQLPTASRLSNPDVKALINAALANAKPMPKTGKGQLVIRSISKKQRPRRKPT